MDELQSELQSGCRPDFTAPRASLGVSVDIPTLWTRLDGSFVYSIQFYRLKNYFFFFFFSFRNSASISFVQACVSYELTYVLESFFTVFFFFYHFHFRIDRFFFFKQITLTDDRSSCTFEMTTNNSFQATITPNNIFFFLLNHDSRFHFIYELYKRNFYRASLFPLFSSCLFDKSGLNELNNRRRSMLQRNSRED